MAPKTILLFRHGEKPNDVNDPLLSKEGVDRAKILAHYIPEHVLRAQPDRIFAAAISKHSVRPYETVRPLSKAVSVPIDASIADADYEVLVQELNTKPRHEGKLIVVCWHHGYLPELVEALGGMFDRPRWKSDVFDLILRLDYSADGSVNTTKIHQPALEHAR